MPDRVKVCNTKRIRNQTAGSRSPARTYGYISILCKTYKISHDEKISCKTHGLDYLEFLFQSFIIVPSLAFCIFSLTLHISQSSLQTMPCLFLKKYINILVTRNRKNRQGVLFQLKL